MRWEQVIAAGISSFFRLSRGWRAPRKGLRILMYHAVGTDVPGDSKNLFNINPDLFEKHVKTIKESKCLNIVPLSYDVECSDSLDVVVTFDDGYKDNLYTAAPILKKNNIPFTVFVTTDYVGSDDSLYLNKNELIQLANISGVTIGSHGKTHSRLTHCSNTELRNELVSSRNYLEDLLDREVNFLSYPHGDADSRVKDMAIEAGYVLASTSRFSINQSGQDLLMLNRVNVLSSDSCDLLTMKIEGDWDWYRFR